MSETKPSSPFGVRRQPTPTPPPSLPLPNEQPDEPPDLTEPDDADELIERLQAQIAALESQLLSALEAATTPLLRVGEGVRRSVLNARSLASMYLTPERDRANHDRSTGRWMVMADTHSLTDWLEEPQALAALARMEAAWEAALQPPSRSAK